METTSPFRPSIRVCPIRSLTDRRGQRGKKCQARNQTRLGQPPSLPHCLFSSLSPLGKKDLSRHSYVISAQEMLLGMSDEAYGGVMKPICLLTRMRSVFARYHQVEEEGRKKLSCLFSPYSTPFPVRTRPSLARSLARSLAGPLRSPVRPSCSLSLF